MVYTDRIHLVADSIPELHEFAVKIGLHRNMYHGQKKGHPHYDLINLSFRSAAFHGGAIMVDKRKVLQVAKASVATIPTRARNRRQQDLL